MDLGLPAPPSYRLAAVDALSRGDEDVYRLLSSKPGVGPNPALPTPEELKAYLDGEFGRYALHVYCGLGLREAVEVVMDSGEVEVDCVDDDGATPLLQAAAHGHSDVVGLLVDAYGADVNRERPRLGGRLNETTPLLAAAQMGHTEIVQTLLSFGADPNYRRQHSRGWRDDSSVLEEACFNLHTAVVQALLSAGADPNSRRSYINDRREDTCALSVAIAIDSPSTVSLLLEYGADPCYRLSHFRGTPDDPTELHVACAKDRLNSGLCVRLLCDAGADVSASMTLWGSHPRHWAPLRVATYFRKLGNVAVLLSCGADPFEVDKDEGVPIIDCDPQFYPNNTSMLLLLDSRPSCPWV